MSVPAPIPPPASVVFPDGTIIYAAGVTSLQIIGTNEIGVAVAGSSSQYTYTFINLTAVAVAALISALKAGQITGQITLNDANSITFSSFLPNPIPAGTPTIVTISGTGFDPSQNGVLQMTSPYGYTLPVNYIDANTITVNLILPVGTWTFSYIYSGGAIPNAISFVAA
jgi:hypothetical protein